MERVLRRPFRARRRGGRFLGLKPQAESCSPFGAKMLPRHLVPGYCCPSGTKVVVPLLRGKISQITADLKGATLFQLDVADRPARLFTPWSHAGLKRETDLRHQPNAPRG